jgi:hypothetical protein
METDMPITNFDKVDLLLPMTGVNNGTVFTDYSLRQRTVTRTGAVTSTAQSKFSAYGSSGYFSGSNTFLTISADSIFTANQDFTIDGWIYPTNITMPDSWRGIFVKREGSSGNNYAVQITNSSVRLEWFENAGATYRIANSPSTLVANQWQHFAICRYGNQILPFLNGVLGTEQTTSVVDQNANVPTRIGWGTSSNRFFIGHMQDISFVAGEAKYTSNFTPPARMAQRTLTRANTGTDSHEYDRAVLFDWNTSAYPLKTATPDTNGNFVASNLIDLEYGVAFIKDGCSPVCRGPYSVDGD